jgi:hypothetical protein
MFGINKLAGAVRALADNLLALAGTVAEANAGLRQRLALDAPEEAPALPGEVIDGPAGLPTPRKGGGGPPPELSLRRPLRARYIRICLWPGRRTGL